MSASKSKQDKHAKKYVNLCESVNSHVVFESDTRFNLYAKYTAWRVFPKRGCSILRRPVVTLRQNTRESEIL